MHTLYLSLTRGGGEGWVCQKAAIEVRRFLVDYLKVIISSVVRDDQQLKKRTC